MVGLVVEDIFAPFEPASRRKIRLLEPDSSDPNAILSSMPKATLDRRNRMAEQTRGEILVAARRLFAQRGYAATSINDIAEEADVAVQTIYARLGSKRGMLIALIDLIDQEAGVELLVKQVQSASTPPQTLSAGVR